MNANMKKWMTAVAVVVAAVVMMSGGNAEAKKDTPIPNPPCANCAQIMRSGTIVCTLVSCQDGCQYVCTDEGMPYED